LSSTEKLLVEEVSLKPKSKSLKRKRSFKFLSMLMKKTLMGSRRRMREYLPSMISKILGANTSMGER
jgi:hypothetical protein